jgi:hypothetical protein
MAGAEATDGSVSSVGSAELRWSVGMAGAEATDGSVSDAAGASMGSSVVRWSTGLSGVVALSAFSSALRRSTGRVGVEPGVVPVETVAGSAERAAGPSVGASALR